MGADRQHHGLEAFPVQQLVQRKVPAQRRVQDDLHAGALDVVNLGIQHIARQAVLGDAHGHPATCHGRCLVDGRLVAPLRQAQGGGQTRGTGAHDGHFLGLGFLTALRRPGVLDLLVGHEALQLADGDRFVELTALAALLAEGRADPSAYQGEGVALPMDLKGLGVLALADQRHVAGNVHASGAGVGAGSPDEVLACSCRAVLVQNVSLELIAKVTQGRLDWTGCELAQRAQRVVLHATCQLLNEGDVLHGALALGDAGQHLQQSPAADSTRHTLAAGFGRGELEEELGKLDHAGIFVHHNHAAGAHHRADFLQRVEINGRVQRFDAQAAAQRSASLHGFELLALENAAADVKDDLAQRNAHGHFHQAGVVDLASEGEDGRALAALGANAAKPVRSLQDDRGRVGVALDVVDVAGLAPQA